MGPVIPKGPPSETNSRLCTLPAPRSLGAGGRDLRGRVALDALDNYQAKVPPSCKEKLIKDEVVKVAPRPICPHWGPGRQGREGHGGAPLGQGPTLLGRPAPRPLLSCLPPGAYQKWPVRDPTTVFLNETTLIYATGAAITAAAGKRLGVRGKAVGRCGGSVAHPQGLVEAFRGGT